MEYSKFLGYSCVPLVASDQRSSAVLICDEWYELKKEEANLRLPLFCTPAGVRTLDTLIKSQVLYQLSYGCIFLFAAAKVRTIFHSYKLFKDFFQKK